MNKEIEHRGGIGYEKTVAFQAEKLSSKSSCQPNVISPTVEMTERNASFPTKKPNKFPPKTSNHEETPHIFIPLKFLATFVR